MSKELWIVAYEQLVEEYLGEGYSDEVAEQMASDNAHDKMCDNIADVADYYKDLRKYGH